MLFWTKPGCGGLCAAGLFALALSSAAVAGEGQLLAVEEVIGDDGYNKTYNDESKSFKDRMKETRATPVVTVDNSRGGFYLGVNGSLGPIYDAEPKSSGGTGFAVGVEPGYVIQGDSWSRFEFGLNVAYHSFSWKVDKATYTMAPMSFMPQFGWGSSLGNNLFGVFKVGFGIATGDLTAKQGGYTYKYTGSNGTMLSGAYDVVYGVGKVQFTGGLGVTHFKYSWSDLSTSGAKTSTDKVTNLNFVNVHGGARIQF